MSGIKKFFIRYEIPTWILFFVIYGSWIGLTLNANQISLPILIFFSAFVTAWQTSFQHEVLHGHPTKNSFINTIIGYPPLAIWIPYEIYKESHLQHHEVKYLTDPVEDPESFYVRRKNWKRYGVIRRTVIDFHNTLLGRLLIGPLFASGKLFYDELLMIIRGDLSHVRIWVFHVIALALIHYWITKICGFSFLMYVFGIAYPATSLILLRSFAEHSFYPNPNKRTAIVKTIPFWSLLYLNNNLHWLHHANPKLSWFLLPKFYKKDQKNILRTNGNYFIKGYGSLFKDFFFKGWIRSQHPTQ